MRKFIWTVTALTVVASVPVAQAEGASKEESIGVGAGAVIGAAAGGPIGFIVGSAIGAKIGDTLHKKNDSIEELSVSLEDSRRNADELELDVRALSADLNSISGDLRELERIAHPELLSLMQAGIEMDLLFRTDESALTEHTSERLAAFGQALASMPNIQIHLDGFADERGAANYNQQLSEQRVSYVRDQLVQAGVSPERISEVAHGEVAAPDASIDSLAFERRVSLKVFIEDPNAFASNP